jgi:SAM-dependent methyltransferase
MTERHAWYDGFEHEKQFWEGWAKRGEAQLLGAVRPLEPAIAELLPGNEVRRTTYRILDVGSGAISTLGREWHGRPVLITQVDVLGYWHEALLRRYGVRQPNTVYSCRGEDMLHFLEGRQFDCVCAINSLDHTEHPDLVLRAMAELTVGPIFLRHYACVGERLKYAGLHQWNVDVCDGRMLIWGRGGSPMIDVNELLGLSGVVQLDHAAANPTVTWFWLGHS